MAKREKRKRPERHPIAGPGCNRELTCGEQHEHQKMRCHIKFLCNGHGRSGEHVGAYQRDHVSYAA